MLISETLEIHMNDVDSQENISGMLRRYAGKGGDLFLKLGMKHYTELAINPTRDEVRAFAKFLNDAMNHIDENEGRKEKPQPELDNEVLFYVQVNFFDGSGNIEIVKAKSGKEAQEKVVQLYNDDVDRPSIDLSNIDDWGVLDMMRGIATIYDPHF